MEHIDVIVVGGGVMGCATAYALARAQRRVLLLEQFRVGHQRGSSHGHSRIIRLAYDAPDYVTLMRAAYRAWADLAAASGAALQLRTGGLDFGAPDAPGLQETRAALAAADVPFEALDAAELARRFAQFRVPPETEAIYQADAGILDADACVAALLAQARGHGAHVQEMTRVRAVLPSGGGVEVQTDSGTYRADRAVLTVGSWTRPVLKTLGLEVPLRVLREQVAFFAPLNPAAFAPGRFPIFIHHRVGAPSGYGFPTYGLPGVKVAFHAAGPEVQPDDAATEVDQERLDALCAYTTELLPGVSGTVQYSVTCRYTMTPDEHFLIDRHPKHPQIVLASPCSGHGFKFGALIGEILADLAVHGRTAHPIGRFGLARLIG